MQKFKTDKIDLSWKALQGYLLILLGAFIQGIALRLFLIPANLVSGGVSGAAQIINAFSQFPIGLMIFIGNVPLFVLGWRFLGGLRFAFRTALAVVAISIFTDGFGFFMPPGGITTDPVLNTLYGGVIYGIGLGLVYRGQGTSGGSDILSRILNYRARISISTSYLLVDALVVLAGGFAFGWTLALYGMVVIYISGLAAEMVSEGESMIRTTLIITACPQEVADKILTYLERGVTILSGTGAYTHAERPVLYCVVSRSEVNQLKAIVYETDPKAFMVIGQAYEALGEGFKPLK